MTETKIEEMNQDECRHWLFADDEAAKSWRLDPANILNVGQLVERYASLKGGEAAHIVIARLDSERDTAMAMDASRLQVERDIEELKRYYRRDHCLAGGLPQDFDENIWPSYVDRLMNQIGFKSAIEAELNKIRAESRRKAARTF